MLNDNKIYDNADSFAMAFDEAWKKDQSMKQKEISQEDKLERVLAVIENHPFILNSPIEARRVAKFRIRLLNLN